MTQRSPYHDNFAACINRMEAIMAQAAMTMRRGTSDDLPALKPLRLKMAGAITSCQVALDRLANDESISPEHLAAARASSAVWQALGNDFRAFTLLNQSSTPQAWDEYLVSGGSLMKRLQAEIRVGRRLLS